MPKRKPRLTQRTDTQLTLFDTCLQKSKSFPAANSSGAAVSSIPRPAATPFFRKMASSAKQNRSHMTDSSADDAWQIAEHVMAASAPSAPPVRCEDEGAPNSDDDFEFQQNSQPSSAARRTLRRSKSSLPNDRSSMTRKEHRRSTDRSLHLSALHKPRRSVFASPRTNKRTVPKRFQTDSESDISVDRIVFDAEKSEMSATDDENPQQQSQSEEESDYEPDLDLDIKPKINEDNIMTTPERSRRRKTGKPLSPDPNDPKMKTPEEFTLNITVLDPSSDKLHAPKKVRDGARPFMRKRDPDAAAVSTNKPRRVVQRRGRLVPRRIAVDSDESDDEQENLSVKHTQSPNPLMVSSQEEGIHKIAQNDEKNQHESSADIEKDEKTTSFHDSQTVGKTKRDDHVVSLLPEDEEDLRTPPETPIEIRHRRSIPGRKPHHQISVTPPSTPSPLSMKKRRRLCKLAVTYSSDDNGNADGDPDLMSGDDNGDTKSHTLTPQTPVLKKDPEWFHERNIDAFSSSSAEFDIMSSVERVSSDTSKAKDGKDGAIRGRALPVRRDIFKNFAEALDTPPRKLKPKQPLAQNETHEEIRGSTEKSDDLDTPIVDLVEDNPAIEIETNSQHNDIVQVVEVDRSNPAPANIMEISDDDRLPPFNLEVLCERGESIEQMKDRLGEEYVMDKVLAAQRDGREIIGGEALGISQSFNRDVFSKFKEVVVSAAKPRNRSLSYDFGNGQTRRRTPARGGGKGTSTKTRGARRYGGRRKPFNIPR